MHTPGFRIRLIHLLIAFLGNEHMGAPAMVENIDIARLEFRRLVECEASCISVTRTKLNHAQPHESLGVPRIEVNLPLQSLNGPRKVIRTVARHTQEQVCTPQVGLQSNRTT